MNYFVTSIHTDSGKTVTSAVLTHALQADYWKPIQCGTEPRDLDTVRSLVNNNHCLFHEEAYLLKTPASPHAAARLEGRKIDLDSIGLPFSENEHMIIEGAGGLMVPLNDTHFIIDLAAKFDAEVVLVCNIYLGSINHSLLTINELKRRNARVKGIVFVGPENPDTENYIVNYSGYKCLLAIRPEKEINQEVVTRYAIKLFENWD